MPDFSLKKRTPSENTELAILFAIIFFLVFLILGILYYNLQSKSNKKTTLVFNENSESITQTTTPIPTPTPTKIPPKPILSGYQQFDIQSSKKSGPIPYFISFDPYDPKINSKQTIVFKLKDTDPITKVTYKIQTDNLQTEAMELKLVSGTVTDGEWQGDFTFKDSHDETYHMVFEAIDSKNQTLKYEFPLR